MAAKGGKLKLSMLTRRSLQLSVYALRLLGRVRRAARLGDA